MLDTTVTAFGASFAGPGQSSALLRARASALGLTPQQVEDQDLVSAVVAAHCWMIVLRKPTLAAVGDADAAAALAAIFCRAAGHAARDRGLRTPAERVDDLACELAALPACSLTAATLTQVHDAIRWAGQFAGVDALIAAAEDLAAGLGSPALAAACQVLLTTAEEILDDAR